MALVQVEARLAEKANLSALSSIEAAVQANQLAIDALLLQGPATGGGTATPLPPSPGGALVDYRAWVPGRVTPDTGAITSLLDLTGAARHATVPAGKTGPTVVADGGGGKPGLSFNGTTDVLEADLIAVAMSSVGGQPNPAFSWNFIGILSPGIETGSHTIAHASSSTEGASYHNGVKFYTFADKLSAEVSNATGQGFVDFSATVPIGTPLTMQLRYNPVVAQGNRIQVRLNDGQWASSAGFPEAWTAPLDRFRFGGTVQGTNEPGAFILQGFEVLDHSMTDAEADAVRALLLARAVATAGGGGGGGGVTVLPRPLLPYDAEYWNICRNPDGLFAASPNYDRTTLAQAGFASVEAVKAAHPLLANEPFDLSASVTWAAHQERVRAGRKNGSVMGARITAPSGQYFQNRTVWYPAALEGGAAFGTHNTPHAELLALPQYPGELNFVGSGMGNTKFVCGKDYENGWTFNGRNYPEVKGDCLAAQFTPHCMFDIGRPGFSDRFTGGEGGAGMFAEVSAEGPGGNNGAYHTPLAWVSGFGWTSRRRMVNVFVDSFRYGATRTGDQTGWYNFRTGGNNYYGLYYDHPNPVSFGDDSYYDCKFQGRKAGIGIHPRAVAGKAQFHMCGWFTSPYGWYKEIDVFNPALFARNNDGSLKLQNGQPFYEDDFSKAWSGIWLHEPQFEAIGYGALSGGVAYGPFQDPLIGGVRVRKRPFIQDSVIVAPQIGPFNDGFRLKNDDSPDHQRVAWFDLSATVGGFSIRDWHETHTVYPGDEALFKIDNPANFSVTNTELGFIFDHLGDKPFLKCAGFDRAKAPMLEAKNRSFVGWYRETEASARPEQYDAVELFGRFARKSTGDGSGQAMGVVGLPRGGQSAAFVIEEGTGRVALDGAVTNAAGKLRYGAGGRAVRGGAGDPLGMMADIANPADAQHLADVTLA